jgi:RNA polymerase sigma factor (sigma-70 family)
MTQEDWNRFLLWLDADAEKAAIKYEDLRQNLTRVLTRRGCPDPEAIVDEAFDRVIDRLPKIINAYEGDAAKYIVRVAVNLCYQRRKTLPITIPIPSQNSILPSADDAESQDRERVYAKLEECLKKLSDGQRELILDYYSENKKEKIEHRKHIADYLGISMNALAIRVLRIRERLQNCLNSGFGV